MGLDNGVRRKGTYRQTCTAQMIRCGQPFLDTDRNHGMGEKSLTTPLFRALAFFSFRRCLMGLYNNWRGNHGVLMGGFGRGSRRQIPLCHCSSPRDRHGWIGLMLGLDVDGWIAGLSNDCSAFGHQKEGGNIDAMSTFQRLLLLSPLEVGAQLNSRRWWE